MAIDADTLTGGDGTDVLVAASAPMSWRAAPATTSTSIAWTRTPTCPSSAGDTIVGFETGKDRIDVYGLFQGFGIISSDAERDGYLHLLVSGGSPQLQFDSDGHQLGDAAERHQRTADRHRAPAKPPADLRRAFAISASDCIRCLCWASGHSPGPVRFGRPLWAGVSLKSLLMHF